MLVLSREQNEKIVFPNLGIKVEILRIGRKRVRIGIDAPAHIDVVRQEIEPQGRGAEAYDKTLHDMRNRLHGATMGLHLAQRQLQSGRLTESDATLEIALQQLELLNDELPRTTKKAPIPTCTSATPRRTLLVEDNRNESALLAEYLRTCGYMVDTVGDGLEAMRYLADRQRPDIVLLDMRMPRLDGPQTVSSIRENPAYRGLKVFAVSGTQCADSGVTIGPRGVDRWFTKPLNPRELVRVMEQEFRSEVVPA